MASSGRAVWVATAAMIKRHYTDWMRMHSNSKGDNAAACRACAAQWETMAYSLGDIFEADSLGFNRETFLRNCGVMD